VSGSRETTGWGMLLELVSRAKRSTRRALKVKAAVPAALQILGVRRDDQFS
jgi:hypothetical protein